MKTLSAWFSNNPKPVLKHSELKFRLISVYYCHRINFYGLFLPNFVPLGKPAADAGLTGLVAAANWLADNENNIKALSAARDTEKSGPREKEERFKHLLSLDVVAMSFVNIIASVRQQFFALFEFYALRPLIMWLQLSCGTNWCWKFA